MDFIGDGYHKAPNESSHKSEMLIEFAFKGEFGKDFFTVRLSENRDFGWENMKSLDDSEGTRAENYIKLSVSEAKQLAEWILGSLEFFKE